MTKLTVITPAGESRAVKADPSTSLMEAIRDAGIDGIVAECGGTAACATCHVFVDEAAQAALEPADEHEEGMLEFAAVEATAASRLSCQVRVADLPEGAVVTLPDTQL
ncbi:MAG: 2Fe-2S iron-sulfur cluster binding domain-containing protein [Vannielia sp.]|uniref:2Fe-2S iron-sulfur cluster-binding protein n=1 Tax=Vannielia sp. TaxID=2813045 RepID=UPI003B8D0078